MREMVMGMVGETNQKLSREGVSGESSERNPTPEGRKPTAEKACREWKWQRHTKQNEPQKQTKTKTTQHEQIKQNKNKTNTEQNKNKIK